MIEGLITIKLEGVTYEETERYRQIIHVLLAQGALNIKNGSATLHFDHNGKMRQIELHVKRWQSDQPDLQSLNKPVKIEMTTQTQKMSGATKS